MARICWLVIRDWSLTGLNELSLNGDVDYADENSGERVAERHVVRNSDNLSANGQNGHYENEHCKALEGLDGKEATLQHLAHESGFERLELHVLTR